MKEHEWFVYFRRFGDSVDEDERVVHFTSCWKLIRFLIFNARDCYSIVVRCMVEGRLGGLADGWKCQ